jgi:5-methylcytosine-specific restriction endonuclease McrA
VSKRAEGKILVDEFREHYDELLSFQDGHCALCPSTGGKIRLNIDHSHRDVIVRGLLCPGCNRAARSAEYKTSDWLRRLADYWDDPPAQRFLRELGQ